MKTLQTYGWNDKRATDWNSRSLDNYIPARVIADFGRQYKVAAPQEITAQLAGSLTHKLQTTDMPKIGDWVAIEMNSDGTAIIHSVLPRTSEIVRGDADKFKMLNKQVVAANVDLAFVIQPLDHDFSPRRLERYLFQLTAQNIETVILLNKSDKTDEALQRQAELNNLNVKTIIMSALNDDDLSEVISYIKPGKTVVVMGSSGAGKSTLINRLMGQEIQATQPIRENDSRGRHTTVHRELFVLPGGGLIIDTPGIRELQLWGNIPDLNASFPEISAAIDACFYRNCSHDTEDQCAVKTGLSDGTIDPKRYSAYQNLRSELQALIDRQGFIENRRSQQSRESFKRRRNRALDSDKSSDDRY